ncbi:hypothetical protein [Oceanimonas smirnovii]|uniref:hypothetical protein n=1 Tax=Oceanimonas smirnovii TaxID=264574 RepID=UPI003FD5FB13
MMMAVRPFQHITVWGRSAKGTSEFSLWCREHLKLPVTITTTPAQAVQNADVICTVTASKEALLYCDDLPERCHINAVGASALGFQEISPEVYSSVDLFVDAREAVWNASTCLLNAKEQGFLTQDSLGTEIGELLALKKYPNAVTSQKTLFKSVGLAAQDLVFARAIVRKRNL